MSTVTQIKLIFIYPQVLTHQLAPKLKQFYTYIKQQEVYSLVLYKKKVMLGYPSEKHSFCRELSVNQSKNLPFTFNHDPDHKYEKQAWRKAEVKTSRHLKLKVYAYKTTHQI